MRKSKEKKKIRVKSDAKTKRQRGGEEGQGE